MEIQMTDRLTPRHMGELFRGLLLKLDKDVTPYGLVRCFVAMFEEEAARREAEAPRRSAAHVPPMSLVAHVPVAGPDSADAPKTYGAFGWQADLVLGSHKPAPAADAPKSWTCPDDGCICTDARCALGLDCADMRSRNKPAPAADDLHRAIDKLSGAVASFANSQHGQSQTNYKAQADALNARDEIKALFETQAREMASLLADKTAAEERIEALKARGAYLEGASDANFKDAEANGQRAEKAEARVARLTTMLGVAQSEVEFLVTAAEANDPPKELALRANDVLATLKRAAEANDAG